jgi:hypothetical protein
MTENACNFLTKVYNVFIHIEKRLPMTDLNALFNHPRIDILEMIDTAIDNGMIYNVDYKDVKDAANRKLEEGYRAAVVDKYLAIDHEIRHAYPELVGGLYYSSYPQAHTLNARDKQIAKAEKEHGDHWMVQAAREYLELVRPVIEKLVIIKGTVVKGRKPSTTPRLTPERTLENTGTCSVCSRNVKLSNTGQIVDHGYTIRYGFQSGNCFGVGHDPIEVSSKGAVAYKHALEAHKHVKECALPKAKEEYATLIAADKIEFNLSREARAVRNAPRSIETDIRYLTQDIEMFEGIITNWVATPLPKA